MFICLFRLPWVFVAAYGLSLVPANPGSSLVVMAGLLTVVSSLVAKHRLYLGCSGSVVVRLQLSCPEARGILLDQRWNQRPLYCKADSTVGPPGKPPGW